MPEPRDARSTAALLAEVLATACLLRGADRAFDLLDERTHGLLVTTGGATVHSVRLTPFLRAAPRVVA